MKTYENPLIITLDSLHAIPSKKALLKLLKNHILILKVGLLRNIEQRVRMSQKLCDRFSELFQANDIEVFPAPLSTRQNDVRTLSPRHLAHLVSTSIPLPDSLHTPTKSQDTVSNATTQASTEKIAPEPPAPASRPFVPTLNSPSTSTAAAPANPVSRWKRFLQAIHLAGILIASAATLLAPATPKPGIFDSSLAEFQNLQQPGLHAPLPSKNKRPQASYSRAPRNPSSRIGALRNGTTASQGRSSPHRGPHDPNERHQSPATSETSSPQPSPRQPNSLNLDSIEAQPTAQPLGPPLTSNREPASLNSSRPHRQTAPPAS